MLRLKMNNVNNNNLNNNFNNTKITQSYIPQTSKNFNFDTFHSK